MSSQGSLNDASGRKKFSQGFEDVMLLALKMGEGIAS